MSTGPKNLAFGDWHSQLFSFAVTAVQKYERQHEGDDQSLHESKVYPPGKGLIKQMPIWTWKILL